MPKKVVFISYSHDSEEHREKVLALSERLRADGLETRLDQYINGTPTQGWPRWMLDQMDAADFVLVVCTQIYYRRFRGHEAPNQGQGVDWEGALITQEIYDSRSTTQKFVPVLLKDAQPSFVPEPLRAHTRYVLTSESSYRSFYDFLLGQAGVEPGEVGEVRPKARRTAVPLTFEESTAEQSEVIESEQVRFSDRETARLSRQLDELFERKERQIIDGCETQEIDRQILDIRRALRKGPHLHAGEFLGDGCFKLIDIVGMGGFATVWRAYHRKLQQLVAIKVLHGQHSQDRTTRERFFRGARKMSELQHQNIVRVLEQEVEDEGWFFFVMEYVQGPNFQQAVLDGGLSVEEKLGVIQQVGQALDFAHRHDLVHRDVKPSNILLDANLSPKLTDFDLVRAADTTGLTATQAMMGTLHFAAPESLMSAKNVGPPADVYSLATTTIFALRGEPLPSGFYRDPEPAITELKCPTPIQQVLKKATVTEPEQRYSAVLEFCTALERGEESKVRGRVETIEDNLNAADAGQGTHRWWSHLRQRWDGLMGRPDVRHKQNETAIHYENFVIQIGVDNGDGYPVQVLNSPAGEGAGRFHLSFDPRVFGSQSEFPDLREPPPNIQELGDQLFNGLFSGSIRSLYDQSLGVIGTSTGRRLRIKLRLDPQNPDLAVIHGLPWEFLYRGEVDEFLCLSRRHSFVRYLELPRPTRPIPLPSLLRILLVTSAPHGLDSLDLERERISIVNVLGKQPGIQVDSLARPTPGALRQTLLKRSYHILHFMGHGGIDPTSGESVLFFENEDGSSNAVTGTNLARQLRDFHTLGLVFLNADKTFLAANALIMGGLPAVVAMQNPISDHMATTFSRVFYQRLASGELFDEALTEGRLAVARESDTLEWGTPVLFARMRDGMIFHRP